MDTIDMQLKQGDYYPLVTIELNGQSLIDILRDFEQRFSLSLAGQYGWLSEREFDWWVLLGEDVDSGNLVTTQCELLGCSCGIKDCWPFSVEIRRIDNVVTWQQFQQPYRPKWDYGQLGPFNFSLNEYKQQIARIMI